jgi:hypothetical protein
VAVVDLMNQLPPFDQLVRRVAALRSGALFGLFLAWFAAWTAIVYLVLDVLVEDVHQQGLAELSSSLMTAFGALFAFLTAFVITIEWNGHRDVEHTVGKEADACVRLVWASASPGCDGAAIRASLVAYLDAVRHREWPTLGSGAGGHVAAHDRMTELQRQVRAIAADPSVRGSVAGDLTAAADAMAVTRADRINAAGHDLPTPLFLLAFLSGIMLTLNAVAVALQYERGYAVVIGGLVILIAMDLALLVALSSPFTGALRVHGRALSRVLDDLESGRYELANERRHG